MYYSIYLNKLYRFIMHRCIILFCQILKEVIYIFYAILMRTNKFETRT